MECLQAVYQYLSGITSLQIPSVSGGLKQTDGSMGIYFVTAPQKPNGDVAATMPYVCMHIEGQHCTDVFNRNQNIQEAILHLELWVKGRSEVPLSNLRNIIHYHLDRQNINYPNNFQGLGITAIKEIGPIRDEEYWSKHLYFDIKWAEQLSGISGI